MRVVFCLLVAAIAAPAADFAPLELMPPGTRVLIGVSVRSLLDSPMIKSLGADAGKVTTQFQVAGMLTGVDLTKDIDRIVAGTTGMGENPPGIAVLFGRFRPEQSTETLKVLDSGMAIAGTAAELKAALARRGGQSTVAQAVVDRFAALGETSDIWIVGDIPEGFHSANPQTKSLDSVDHLEFGLSLRDGLLLNGQIHVKDPNEAAKMESALHMIAAMLKAQPASSSGTKFDLTTDNGTVKVSVFVPQEELKKGIAAQKDALAGMVFSGLNGAKVTAGPPVVRPVGIPISRPPTTAPAIVTNDKGETVSVRLPGGR